MSYGQVENSLAPEDRSRKAKLGPPEDMAVMQVLLDELPLLPRDKADTVSVKIVDAMRGIGANGPKCRCGLPMAKNPHPDAGKPFTLLETGPVWVCIPCGSKTLHAWAERAQKAESALHKIQDAIKEVIGA